MVVKDYTLQAGIWKYPRPPLNCYASYVRDATSYSLWWRSGGARGGGDGSRTERGTGYSSCTQVCVRHLNSKQDHPITMAGNDGILASEIKSTVSISSTAGMSLDKSYTRRYLGSNKATSDTNNWFVHKLVRRYYACLACLASLDTITSM